MSATDTIAKPAPQITWPDFVNCPSVEQFLRDKAIHDAQMRNPAYIGFARYRYTAMKAKLQNRWKITVAEWLEFQASIPPSYTAAVGTPITDDQRAAIAAAQVKRAEIEARAKYVREQQPVPVTMADVMARSPEARTKFFEENPALAELWVTGGTPK